MKFNDTNIYTASTRQSFANTAVDNGTTSPGLRDFIKDGIQHTESDLAASSTGINKTKRIVIRGSIIRDGAN